VGISGEATAEDGGLLLGVLDEEKDPRRIFLLAMNSLPLNIRGMIVLVTTNLNILNRRT
jgi:hypothetical protein